MSSRSALQRTDDAVLYAAAFAATVTSTLALTTTIASPGFSSRALTAITAGFATSWVMHARGIRSRTLPYLLLVIALVALSPWWGHPRRFNTLIPQEFINELDFRLAGLVFLFAALRTFSLETRGDLLFCAVPGLSLFGVTAYRRPDSEFMALFFAFVLASAFLVGYDHLLGSRPRVEATAAPEAEGGLRRDHLIATTILCIIALTVATGTALALRVAGERYQSTVLRRIGAVASRPAGKLPGYMLGGDRIPIGTGPAALGDSEIMWVRTDTPGNWRLKVYDEYRGRTWGRGVKPLNEPVEGTAGEFDFERLLSIRRRSREQQQYEVHVTRGGDSDIAAVAPPAKVRLHLRGRPVPRIAYLDRHGTVSLGRNATFGRGDWYEVIAQPGAEVSTHRVGSTARTRSLQLPLGYSPQVACLVKDLTRDLEPTDELAKVRTIQDYLIQTCRYDKSAPAVPGTEKDVVEYFLLKSNHGDCDLFATALCVMCRLAGVPARFAIGYAPGEPGREANTYIVRERDSHAWAEVALKGVGWATVDPTAGAVSAAKHERGVPWVGAVSQFLRRHARTIGVLAAIGLALYLIGYLHPRAARRSAPVHLVRGPSSDVIACYRRACRMLERMGCRRADWQTPVEYAAVCRALPLLVTAGPLFEQLTWLFVKARYARSGASLDDAERASRAFAAMRSALGRRPAPATHQGHP